MATFDKTKYGDTSTNRLINEIIALFTSTHPNVVFPRELYEDTSTNRLLYALLKALGGTVDIDPGDGGFPVPEFLNTLSFDSGIAQVIDIGSAPGGNDILAGIVITPDVTNDQTLNVSNQPGTKYYVTGYVDLIIKTRV